MITLNKGARSAQLCMRKRDMKDRHHIRHILDDIADCLAIVRSVSVDLIENSFTSATATMS